MGQRAGVHEARRGTLRRARRQPHEGVRWKAARRVGRPRKARQGGCGTQGCRMQLCGGQGLWRGERGALRPPGVIQGLKPLEALPCQQKSIRSASLSCSLTLSLVCLGHCLWIGAECDAPPRDNKTRCVSRRRESSSRPYTLSDSMIQIIDKYY